jgi:hypothetical protein
MTMSDELTNEIVLSASRGILRRMRWYRFFVYLVAVGFGYGFVYVLTNEPVLNTGVVVLLVGSAIGVFSAVALLNAVGVEITNQKMVIKLAKAGVMSEIVRIMNGKEN